VSREALGPQFDDIEIRHHRDALDTPEHPLHILEAYHQGTYLGGLDYVGPNQRGEVSIGSVVVQPEHRRKGVGSRLLSELGKAHPENELVAGGTHTKAGKSLLGASGFSQTKRKGWRRAAENPVGG